MLSGALVFFLGAKPLRGKVATGVLYIQHVEMSKGQYWPRKHRRVYSSFALLVRIHKKKITISKNIFALSFIRSELQKLSVIQRPPTEVSPTPQHHPRQSIKPSHPHSIPPLPYSSNNLTTFLALPTEF